MKPALLVRVATFPLTALTCVALLLTACAAATTKPAALNAEPAALPPAYAVPSQLGDKVFEDASLEQPRVLRSLDDARPYYDKEGLARLEQLVDFVRQHILLFAWSGSGQDKLTYEVLESAPEQIAFKYEPGRTRDLRRHVYAFALRNDVTWMMRR